MTASRFLLALAVVVLVGCPSPPDSVPAERPDVRTAASTGGLAGIADELLAFRTTDNDVRREALIALLHTHGFEPELHAFPNDGRAGQDPRETGYNVIVDVGDGPRDIIIGAHFDAVPVGEGMIDNAASVVVLVRAARALRDRDTGHRIRFVFFDMEEIGLVGARHFAGTLDASRVRAMVNLDVNGYGDTVFYGHTRHGHDELYRAMRRGCLQLDIRCIDFERYPPSDNLAFERAGFPNISLSVLPRTEVHQLWLMMHAGDESGLVEGFLPGVFLNIHTAGDTLDRIEPEAMTLAHDALLGLVAELTR